MSSYKAGNKIDELKAWISENDEKICLIPNAKDADIEIERKIQKDVAQLEQLGFKVTVISLKDYFNKKEELKQRLKDFHAFYVVGGNTFVLRKAMRLSGFDEYLESIKTNPKHLYAGYSAGICVLSKSLHGLEIVDKPDENPYDYNNIIWEGLGFIDYLPLPHYKSDHPESKLIDKEVEYCIENNITFRTLKDGEVIIQELSNN